MSDPGSLMWLIPVLPLAASVLIALLGPSVLRRASHLPCIVAIAASFVLSVIVLVAVERAEGDRAVWTRYYTWFQAGGLDVGFTLRADGLSAIMLATVTFIGCLIAIYSAGYMHGDPGYPRFFAEVSLFIFSMTGLVLADNFLVLYAFWEGVGLCSYLLIGFWFTRPAAADAARKAFLVTRIGDLGFILGIILIWVSFNHEIGYDAVFAQAPERSRGLLTAVCLLLFCGAVGKSAQFPLHVWLPDAMEGPTPVSALIHAATMVTAGVYMVARCLPLFREVPDVLFVVACIGAFTALLAALIALTQNDLKRVLAYSTISQLGYMFLALGSGTTDELVRVAAVAAIFHLFTHAFFKALLFLAAGSVMHAMGNVIDMRRFGGLRRVLPTTHWTFLCGALALAAVPPLSGFWSKDEILGVAYKAGTAGHPLAGGHLVLFMSALLTACLTAFYTARVYFLTFWGEVRIPAEAGEHAHESPPIMLLPLMILAVAAVCAGGIAEPATHWFSKLLNPRWTQNFMPPATIPGHTEAPEGGPDLLLIAAGTAVALGGILLAWWMYARRPGSAARLAARFRAMYQLSLNKFHFDELYDFFVVQPLRGLAAVCRVFDMYVLDAVVDLIGNVPRLLGAAFRPMQNGLVQFYALAMISGLTVFLIALLLAAAR